MDNLFKTFLDVIYPPFCIGCGKFGAFICRKCMQESVEFNHFGFCVVCRIRSVGGVTHAGCLRSGLPPDGLTSPFIYSGLIRSGILKGKFGAKTYAIINFLILLSIKHLTCKLFEQGRNVLVVPIPLDKKRLEERGFSQTDLIAKALAQAFKFEVKSDALIKSANFKIQAGLGRVERFKNAKGSLMCKNPSLVYNKDIILVDDITTTGATLIEASKVLKEAGARFVWCFTLAKSGLNPPYWAS